MKGLGVSERRRDRYIGYMAPYRGLYLCISVGDPYQTSFVSFTGKSRRQCLGVRSFGGKGAALQGTLVAGMTP